MSVEGAAYPEIIGHYYQGSNVAPSVSDPIWVNLERDFASLQLTVGDVGAEAGTPVVISSPAGEISAVSGAIVSLATLTPGCSVSVLNPGQAAVVVEDGTCAFDFQWYDWAAPGLTPTTKIQIDGCTLADWNVAPTTFRPCQYAQGMLHLRSGPGGLDLSAEMLLEDYMLGISEMPFAWPMSALEAQAVASRSYALARQLERGDPASNTCDGWCHVKDSTSDQRYVGWGHANTSSWVQAVQNTAGLVVTHADAPNGVVTAFYSSSSGGKTENVEERFGGDPRQYLSSVDDKIAIDGTVVNPKASWQFSIAPEVVEASLGLEVLLGVEVTARRTSGSAELLEYSGLVDGQVVVLEKTGTWTRTEFGLYSEYLDVSYTPPFLESDEVFFYRATDGVFKYYNEMTDGALGSMLKSGTYSLGWDSITNVDLDGDGHDEMFFYRGNDGVFKYYNVNPDGSLGTLVKSGVYSKGWTAITAVDLDGDSRDEFLFYRSTDGVFKYYDVTSSGSLGAPLKSGFYSTGWDSITKVDLDGDGKDELFFYRPTDGVFKYYDATSTGSLGVLLKSSVYSPGWSSISAIDLDGDGEDEMLFYRSTDGQFKYYNVKADGSLGALLKSGNYSLGWTTITAVQLD